jgi:hypothetical protein
MMQASLHIRNKTTRWHTSQPTPCYIINKEVALMNMQCKRPITTWPPTTTQYQRRIKTEIASVPLEWSHPRPTQTIYPYLRNLTI